MREQIVPGGYLTEEQREALRPFVAGRVVHDLGCGPAATLAYKLLALGAKEVVAVDKNADYATARPPKGVRFVRMLFSEFLAEAFEDPLDIAFVSWPINGRWDNGLVPILERARLVIYLGHNFDGVACGTPDLFGHLLRRRLVKAVPWRNNSLLVTGEFLAEPREPTPEEAAGIEAYTITNANIRAFDPGDWTKFLNTGL